MRRKLALALLLVLLAISIRAFVREKLFSQQAWTHAGLERFAAFTLAYWAVAGLILWRRRAWLPAAAAAFVFLYSTWWCAEFFTWAAPLAVVYFLGSSFLLGRWIARTIDAIAALLVGLAVWIFAISIALHFQVNTRWVYAAAFAVPYVWAFASKWRPPGWHPATSHPVLIYVLLAQWLAALTPDISADGLAMHLAIPAMVARDGRFAFDVHRYAWAVMPMGGDFAFTAVYLLGGEMAARLLDFALLAAIAAMIYRVSRRWLSPDKASLAAALFVSTPLVQLVTGSVMVENVWAAFVLGASLALIRGELAWAGLLFGAALATKVGSFAYVAPALIAAIVLWRKAPKKFGWRTAAAAGALCLAFAAHPYLNAWHRTGNPVFPFENQIFKSPDFDATAPFQDPRYRKPIDWKTPYDLTFRSWEFYEGQKGGLGFQYFLLVPALLLLLNRKAPRIAIALGIGGAILTLASQPNLRYLYPALPLLSIAIAWLLSEIPWLWAGAAAILALNLWFLPDSGWYHADFAVFDRSQLEQYLAGYAPQRAAVEAMNRIAPGEPAAFIGFSDVADLNARAYYDDWHCYRFWRDLIDARDAAQVAAIFRQFGIYRVIATVPSKTWSQPLEDFLERWTAPAGFSSGPWQDRNVLAAPLSKPVITIAASGAYDDADEHIEFTGAWAHGRQFTQASDYTVSYSDQAGANLRFSFVGGSITYVYTKALNRGIAEIAIDGQPRARMDLYSAATVWQAQAGFTGLGGGSHTIEIRVTGQKNPASSGAYVDLDRFIVAQN
ncbi:MAG: hypothetical protein ACRD30_02540 [Bryobacteraceae bacterium]